ncbi:metallophosphoesterase family protein [Sorangium cellulosum]|uniref:Calcineurin-like phosphoesterase domain-containing protein n=1 Tax=Sorangium cellulosum So0157-2 TaxID=1254432 RepID=S4XPS4_SORCE|nr:metallophosphoesterase [Sorangium cellulosum]AGP35197.1 hypothetical protein SCE1572_12125 [Sorangium cellulosum So0157-2]
MVKQKPITLLHLSDMQFGPHHRFEGPSSPGSLLQRLRDDLERLRDEEGIRPDLVLLTGDLTEYGMKSQFDQLLSFAHGLTEVTELAPRRVVVVPGNHDVNWKLCQAHPLARPQALCSRRVARRPARRPRARAHRAPPL